MIIKFKTCAIIALLLIVRTNSIQVHDKGDENATTQESDKEADHANKLTSMHQTTDASVTEQVRSEEQKLTTAATTTTHKIPPTLLNAKVEIDTEKSPKVLA